MKEIDGRWVTVRAYLVDGVYIVGTAPVYESLSEVKDFLERKGYPKSLIYERNK
ncbi:hypothetical protein [Halosimplex amylolyticum]|uniref:hypothetical protein n=1 Tax=Halosimplex amylolyticum TaxID=3396616 RepID=UPI003F56F9D0